MGERSRIEARTLAIGSLVVSAWAASTSCGGDAASDYPGVGGSLAGMGQGGAVGLGGSPVGGVSGSDSGSGGFSGFGNAGSMGGASGVGGGASPGGSGGGTSPGGTGGAPTALDVCGPVTLLSGEQQRVTGTVAGSANDFDGCPGEGPEEVLRWTPPAPGRYVIDTFGSRFDTVLYVGSDLLCNEPAPASRCSDDFDGIRSLVALDSMGEAAFIVVDGYNSAVGGYVLNFRAVAACPHFDLGANLGARVFGTDDFGRDAVVLGPAGISTCGGSPVGVTFAWQAPEDGNYSFSSAGSEFSTVLALRDGCRGAVLTCDDGGASGVPLIQGGFTAGQRVVIELGALSSEAAIELGGAELSIAEL